METLNQKDHFHSFLRLNDRKIYAYILSILKNVHDADDVMQETSIVMWNKFSAFSPGMDFVLWGITIARYQILAFLRDKKRTKVKNSKAIINSIHNEVTRKLQDIDYHLDLLKKCAQKLDTVDRHLLKLRYEKGYTLQKIGELVSKSTRATYYSLARIHKLLLGCIRRNLAEQPV